MKGRCRDPDAPGHRGAYIRQHHSMLPLLGSIHEIQDIRSTAHERRLPAKADLIDRKITLSLSDEAKAWLGRVGYDPVYGARPLKRAIQRYLQDPLADMLLRGGIPDGATVMVNEGDGGLVLALTN